MTTVDNDQTPSSDSARSAKDVHLQVPSRRDTKYGQSAASHKSRRKQLEDSVILFMMRREAVVRVMANERLRLADHRRGIP